MFPQVASITDHEAVASARRVHEELAAGQFRKPAAKRAEKLIASGPLEIDLRRLLVVIRRAMESADEMREVPTAETNRSGKDPY
jgi:hypothetical protein